MLVSTIDFAPNDLAVLEARGHRATETTVRLSRLIEGLVAGVIVPVELARLQALDGTESEVVLCVTAFLRVE
jgi:hypothetical protein